MKHIKKLLITLIVFSLGFTALLTGCNQSPVYEYSGLENFTDYCADYFNLHECLLPENMLDNYEYTDGDYYYADYGLASFEPIVSYLWLEYDEEVYEEAKQYMLDSVTYSTKVHYSYNNYEFYENLDFPEKYNRLDENGENKLVLSHFIMICYNDVNRRLMFIGYYSGRNAKKYVEKNGWGAFLKENFSRYNFDE